jgi:hypothetical protein
MALHKLVETAFISDGDQRRFADRLSWHGIAHWSGARIWQSHSGCDQFVYFFLNQLAERFESVFLGFSVAHAAPREQVWTVADVELIVFFPADEFEVLVLRFHRFAWRMAFRTCFS